MKLPFDKNHAHYFRNENEAGSNFELTLIFMVKLDKII